MRQRRLERASRSALVTISALCLSFLPVTSASGVVIGDRRLSPQELRALIGATSSGVSAPTLLYLWGGFVVPLPVIVARDSSVAFSIATAMDLRAPSPSLSGSTVGTAFPVSTVPGGGAPGLAARDSSAAAPVYLAGDYLLPRPGASGFVAGVSFPVMLTGAFQGGGAGNVATVVTPAFPTYLGPGFTPQSLGLAGALQGPSFGLRLSLGGDPGFSAVLASTAFDLYAAGDYRRPRQGSSVDRTGLAFALRSAEPYAEAPVARSGEAASAGFAGYLAGDFVRRPDGRAGEAAATAFVLRLLAMAEGRMGSAVSPPFPLVLGGGPVAVTVSLVRAEFAEGVAHVSWRLHDHQGEYAVERALTPDEWTELGRFLPDGKGEIAVEDRDVTAGQRYGYRVVGDDAVRSGLGEVWVEVPLFQLGMTGATPNPARLGQLMVSFVLPDREPARLEVLDVAGRIVASHDVGALGPGAHVFDASRGVRFSPGVYFLRLVRAERALVKKATLTR